MAIALVAHTVKAADTTDAIDTTGSTLLVVGVTWYTGGGATPATPTDSKSNSPWTEVFHDGTDPNSAGVSLFYVKNPTSVGSGHTFTSAGGGGLVSTVFVLTFSGTDTTADVDQQAHTQSAASATVQPGSVTPTANGEVLVTIAADYTGSGATYSIGSGFTITDQLATSSTYGGAVAYFVQPTAAAINPTWTSTLTEKFKAGIATFKASAGGPTTIDHDGLLFQYSQTARRITI